MALKTDSGETVWTFPTHGAVYPAPAVDDQRVYTGSWDGQCYAIDKKTGAPDWAYSSFGELPDSASDVIWKGMFICRTNGQELWHYTGAEDGPGPPVPPTRRFADRPLKPS